MSERGTTQRPRPAPAGQGRSSSRLAIAARVGRVLGIVGSLVSLVVLFGWACLVALGFLVDGL